MDEALPRITVKGATGKPRIIYARNVHYSPDFHTNAISKSKWKDWGLVVCEWTNTMRFKGTRQVLCSFWEVAEMSAIEDGNPEPNGVANVAKLLSPQR